MINLDRPLISIIILNYNAGKLLLNCVESILHSNYNNFEIIVVDNISNDESHKHCKEKFEQINLIENHENLGYCEGNNVGIRNAKGDFVIILNPDTEVDPLWLDELLSAYREFGEGIYQPKILSVDEKNVLQSTGNKIHLFGFGYSRDLGIIDTNQHNKIEHIGYAAGTCLFTSVGILQRLDMFDPFIFLYHDDLDLGWRAWQQGIKSYYVPKSVIYHVKSYNLKWSAQKFFWLERNRKYCLLTHYSKETYKKMAFWLALADILIWFVYLTKGFVKAKIRAEQEIKKNKDKIAKKYIELENKKIVSDKEVIKNFSDTIFVSDNISRGLLSSIFNSLLGFMSRRARKSILSG
ncbi:glycosyltransferase family 2 protein [Candidatus Nitrosotenuis aquarius]|uniref:glycosyltransferase family 2 protein n=1 Tax=Candidatus Nitrosotenuis aquarius TaxID=1846278 RepID=UPI000C1F13E0|nr:glycosyltransferase family 2 protein [Candidatus Nitrosotenuis aquarius]